MLEASTILAISAAPPASLDDAVRAVLARLEAHKGDWARASAEELLAELVLSPAHAAPELVARLDPAKAARREIAEHLERARVKGAPAGPSVALLLDDAERERGARGGELVGVAELLLALAQSPRGAAAEAIRRAGWTHGRIARLLATGGLGAGGDDGRAGAGDHAATTEDAAARREGRVASLPLELPFTVDLTARAERGELDPVIGRDAIVERVIEVLARRTKNHPLLVGPPGVGKSAIVEGLAQRIASGQVPRFLAACRLLALDLGGMVAGARMRGDLEERLAALLERVEAAAGGIVLFVDEAHLLGAAAAGEGAIAIGGLLKPALARGRLPVIGATTQPDFKRHIEPDAALERRFSPVAVDEPGDEEARAMLAGLKARYEAHHGVVIDDGAMAAAVSLTRRYVPGRQLPDKAIDALDEAAAHARCGAGDRAVDADAIAEVVSRWTGVPLGRLAVAEARRATELEAGLGAEVLGQATAISRIARAVRRARAGLTDGRRPLSILLAGPTGSGKTALARALARALYGDAAHEEPLVRVDLAEYGEAHAAARLVGSPPGYVGHGEGGQLTEPVRRRPHSLVLFDEADKAHPRALAPLLALLDEGRLTDGEGRTVDFRHAVVVLTAQVDAGGLEAQDRALVEPTEVWQAHVERALAARLPAELLGRIDAIVPLVPLETDARVAIAASLIRRLREALARRGVELLCDDEALARRLVSRADVRLGARPLRRLVDALVVEPIAAALPRFEADAAGADSPLVVPLEELGAPAAPGGAASATDESGAAAARPMAHCLVRLAAMPRKEKS